MLSLDSERWRDLRHAYGAAEDIPELLKQLESHPDDGDDAEPWFSLWSALAHQGDVFQASFAAIPHVVAALSRAPASAPPVFFGKKGGQVHFSWPRGTRVRLVLQPAGNSH